METSGNSLLLSAQSVRRQRIGAALGRALLLGVASLSALAVVFIFVFITRDALPFFRIGGWEATRQFFTSTRWYPSAATPEFGALAIFAGTGIVTLGAAFVAVPLGVLAAVCLSDMLPFTLRQFVKPVIEILAAIPSVAFGFFALVVLAPLLQERGGPILAILMWITGLPTGLLVAVVATDLVAGRFPAPARSIARMTLYFLLGGAALGGLYMTGSHLWHLNIPSGTNALNAALILGIMALPTVVSVSEDALQSVGRELREGSFAVGATRAETLVKVVLPAAASGIAAAVILGIMRAMGETMVVWMASGNAARVPVPWFNLLDPVRTLTATIAGDMGEADHVTGSLRFHVLFVMALCLLTFSFVMNLATEVMVRRTRKKLTGGK